jgi:hypothetical protein
MKDDMTENKDSRTQPHKDPADVVDELEDNHVHTPEAEPEIDPASSTTDGTGDVNADEAGSSEPPD